MQREMMQRVMNRLKSRLRELQNKHYDSELFYTADSRKEAKELKDAINFYSNIMNPVEYFRQILKDNAVKWSESLQLDLGVRVVEISQNFLFELACKNKMQTFWFALKKKLPADVVLIDLNNNLIHYKVSTAGNYIDTLIILFGSSHWEKLPKGYEFPLFEIEFNRQDLGL